LSTNNGTPCNPLILSFHAITHGHSTTYCVNKLHLTHNMSHGMPYYPMNDASNYLFTISYFVPPSCFQDEQWFLQGEKTLIIFVAHETLKNNGNVLYCNINKTLYKYVVHQLLFCFVTWMQMTIFLIHRLIWVHSLG